MSIGKEASARVCSSYRPRFRLASPPALLFEVCDSHYRRFDYTQVVAARLDRRLSRAGHVFNDGRSTATVAGCQSASGKQVLGVPGPSPVACSLGRLLAARSDSAVVFNPGWGFAAVF